MPDTPPLFDVDPAKTYCIKPGYGHRRVNATLEGQPGDYWDATRELLSRHVQHAVYALAAQQVRDGGLKTVLDVGCGMADKLHEQLHPIARVMGVDQPSVVQAVAQRFPDLPVVAADFERPRDAGLGTFDLVLSVDVVEHLLDPDQLLAFIRAHTHAGSLVLISTPERDVRRGIANDRSHKAAHVREWNRTEFAAYLEASGFSVQQHRLLPAFRVGGSRYMLKERLRLLRKRVPLRYTQVALCRLKD